MTPLKGQHKVYQPRRSSSTESSIEALRPMGSTLRTVLVVVVAIGLTTGCQMLGWLIGVAAKALPYLLFFAEASPDPGVPFEPYDAEEEIDLALRRARDPGDPLPSAIDLVSVRFPGVDRTIELHALQVTPGSSPDSYLDLLHQLESQGTRARVLAADVRPLLDLPPAVDMVPIRSADGPLAALVRPDLNRLNRD